MTTASPLVMALDVGGTKLAAAAVRADGTIVHQVTVATEAHKGGDIVLARLCRLAHQLKEAMPCSPAGIGIATHGIVEPERGIVRFATSNLPGWTGTHLKERIEEQFPGIPVHVGNDGHAATLAEHRFGQGRGTSTFIMLIIGTGVGGGIISNGRLLTGAHGAAGRLGHLSIDPDGPLCSCGNRGCVELYVSGTGIARHASEVVRQSPQYPLSQILSERGSLSARDVVQAAKHGNILAQDILQEAGAKLGLALVQLMRLFDPSMIAIGGGMASAGELLLEPARRVLRSSTPPELTLPAIVPALLGSNASLIGAAVLGWQAANGQFEMCLHPGGQM